MSIKYSVNEIKSPVNPDEPAKFYARAQVREVIDMDRIASEIAFSTSLTEGDVLNVIRNIPNFIFNHLADGDMVVLGHVGKFQVQLKSELTDKREEFGKENIKGARIQFRPGSLLKKGLLHFEYEEVIPLKKKKELKRHVKNKEE